MKKILFNILRIALSFGILIYIFSIIPFKEVLLNLSSANVWYVLIALFVVQVNIYLNAIKLSILTKKQKMSITVGSILKINYLTRFYSLFLPQVISNGVFRFYSLSKNDKKPAETLAAMIFNQLSDIQTLVFMGLFFWVIDTPPESNNITGISLMLFTVILLSVYPIILNKKLYLFVINCFSRISFVPQIIIEKFEKLAKSLVRYQGISIGELASVYGFSFAIHIVGLLSMYIFALAIDLNISLISIGWIRTILLIICLIPISINGIGFREGSLIFMLGLYGISSASAVTFSFLIFMSHLFGAVVGGAYLLVDLFFSGHKKLSVENGVKECNE